MKPVLAIVSMQGVRCYVDEHNTAWLNAEDVARGLGFTHKQTINGKEYFHVRWSTVNGYLKDFGFCQDVGKDDFLPESIFYRLAMKASNQTAQAFQSKVADEILPSIRQNGLYINPHAPIDPRFLRRMADALEQRDKQIAALNTQVAELKPKADYRDNVLVSDEHLTSELIAKEYGKPAQWLNELLGKLGILYKRGRHHYLKAPYADKGYRISDTKTLARGKTVVNHYWTQRGREFVYQVLKKHGIVPIREREEAMSELF